MTVVTAMVVTMTVREVTAVAVNRAHAGGGQGAKVGNAPGRGRGARDGTRAHLWRCALFRPRRRMWTPGSAAQAAGVRLVLPIKGESLLPKNSVSPDFGSHSVQGVRSGAVASGLDTGSVRPLI